MAVSAVMSCLDRERLALCFPPYSSCQGHPGRLALDELPEQPKNLRQGGIFHQTSSRLIELSLNRANVCRSLSASIGQGEGDHAFISGRWKPFDEAVFNQSLDQAARTSCLTHKTIPKRNKREGFVIL